MRTTEKMLLWTCIFCTRRKTSWVVSEPKFEVHLLSRVLTFVIVKSLYFSLSCHFGPKNERKTRGKGKHMVFIKISQVCNSCPSCIVTTGIDERTWIWMMSRQKVTNGRSEHSCRQAGRQASKHQADMEEEDTIFLWKPKLKQWVGRIIKTGPKIHFTFQILAKKMYNHLEYW